MEASPREGAAELAARWARVQRAVLEFRREHFEGAEGEAQTLAAARALLEAARLRDLGAVIDAPSTIHVSAVDSEGCGCAITGSAGYGSGVMVPGTGIWLNNALGEVDLHPRGLAALPVGTRLASNMAPSVARRSDGSVLAVGSPGASRITTALAQVLFNHIARNMPLERAIAEPRLHVERFEGALVLAHEPGLEIDPIADLRPRPFAEHHMYFGGVAAARWDPCEGIGVATDERRGGGTAVAS